MERFWRSVKYEEVSVKDYDTVPTALANLKQSFTFYHEQRLHQSLGYQTPAAVFARRFYLIFDHLLS
jgi:putative transposase